MERRADAGNVLEQAGGDFAELGDALGSESGKAETLLGDQQGARVTEGFEERAGLNGYGQVGQMISQTRSCSSKSNWTRRLRHRGASRRSKRMVRLGLASGRSRVGNVSSVCSEAPAPSSKVVGDFENKRLFSTTRVGRSTVAKSRS